MNRHEDESLKRTLAARRKLERRCKSFDGLCEFLIRLEQEPFPTPAIRRIAAKARLRPIRAGVKPFDQGEEVERCRLARRNLENQCKSLDEMFDRMERSGAKLTTARSAAKRRAKPTSATSAQPHTAKRPARSA